MYDVGTGVLKLYVGIVQTRMQLLKFLIKQYRRIAGMDVGCAKYLGYCFLIWGFNKRTVKSYLYK